MWSRRLSLRMLDLKMALQAARGGLLLRILTFAKVKMIRNFLKILQL